jgi:hypothetical protein
VTLPPKIHNLPFNETLIEAPKADLWLVARAQQAIRQRRQDEATFEIRSAA